MTEEPQECCNRISTKLDAVHTDLVNITPRKDLNIISRPIPENGAILMGFPGSGLVGTIALQYLVDQLEFEQIGSMNSRYFPPLAMMNKGLINDPVRVYAKKTDAYSLAAIVADIPIAPPICYEIASALMDWLEPFKPAEVLTIAGIVTNESEKRVFGVATTEEALQRINNHTLVLPIGSISGIASSILTECKARNIPAVGLLGETINAPDPRASAATIDVLNKMYNLALDIQPLIEQAVEIEQTMGKLAEEVQQSADATPKKDLPMYG